ncbi:MAG: hypothetical protein WC483_06575 [Candidatus Paceibacterota bacterium]
MAPASMNIYEDQLEAIDMIAKAHGYQGFSDYMREVGLEHVRAAEKGIIQAELHKTPVFTLYSKLLGVALFSIEKWENGGVKE